MEYLQISESEAYGNVVSAFRSQGELTFEKQKVLSELQDILHISRNRHTAELLRSENDPLVQRIVVNNISNHREEIMRGDLNSEYPPTIFIPPPVQTSTTITSTKFSENVVPTKKRIRKKKGVVRRIQKKVPPKKVPTRKRKRNFESAVNEDLILQPPPKRTRTQKVQKSRRPIRKEQKLPQLPPLVKQIVPPPPPPVKIFPFDIDLTQLANLNEVQNYIDNQSTVIDDIEKEWTRDKIEKVRDEYLSKVRSERYRLKQVIHHVENSL